MQYRSPNPSIETCSCHTVSIRLNTIGHNRVFAPLHYATLAIQWVRCVSRPNYAINLCILLTHCQYNETEYCITLYFRGRKISRKVNLKYFREKIFSRIYCSRENIFLRKYLPAKISSRENILSRKYLPAKISSRENRLPVSSS